jgi:hypothetical protein
MLFMYKAFLCKGSVAQDPHSFFNVMHAGKLLPVMWEGGWEWTNLAFPSHVSGPRGVYMGIYLYQDTSADASPE